MRFLKNTTVEEVNDIIARSSDKMLIYVRNAPAGAPSLGIVQGEAGPSTDGVSVTFEVSSQDATYTYTYPYEPDTVLYIYINNIVSEHQELQTGGSFTSNIYDKNENNLTPMKNNTLQEIGISAGDTLRCVESFR